MHMYADRACREQDSLIVFYLMGRWKWNEEVSYPKKSRSESGISGAFHLEMRGESLCSVLYKNCARRGTNIITSQDLKPYE